MVETSKDVLNIVIASAIGLVTLFVCWLLWYVIRVMRQANHLVDSIKAKVEAIDGILKSIRQKLDNSASHLSLLAKGITQIMGYLKTRQDKKSKKSK
ncbi:MAG: hypothetical protein ABIB97_04760 [Patescibacteria group bacterium]